VPGILQNKQWFVKEYLLKNGKMGSGLAIIHLTLSPIHPFYCPAYSRIMETQIFSNFLHGITITNISIIYSLIFSFSLFALFPFEEFSWRGSCNISLESGHLLDILLLIQ